jgi:hypothetical protein
LLKVVPALLLQARLPWNIGLSFEDCSVLPAEGNVTHRCQERRFRTWLASKSNGSDRKAYFASNPSQLPANAMFNISECELEISATMQEAAAMSILA